MKDRRQTEYLFVNGKDPDRSTLLGRIVADILEPDPDLIQTEALQRRMKMIKSSADGRKKMEDLLERYVDERSAEREIQAKLGLLYRQVKDNDISLTKAAKYADMTPEAFGEAMQAYEASLKS